MSLVALSWDRHREPQWALGSSRESAKVRFLRSLRLSRRFFTKAGVCLWAIQAMYLLHLAGFLFDADVLQDEVLALDKLPPVTTVWSTTW